MVCRGIPSKNGGNPEQASLYPGNCFMVASVNVLVLVFDDFDFFVTPDNTKTVTCNTLNNNFYLIVCLRRLQAKLRVQRHHVPVRWHRIALLIAYCSNPILIGLPLQGNLTSVLKTILF